MGEQGKNSRTVGGESTTHTDDSPPRLVVYNVSSFPHREAGGESNSCTDDSPPRLVVDKVSSSSDSSVSPTSHLEFLKRRVQKTAARLLNCVHPSNRLRAKNAITGIPISHPQDAITGSQMSSGVSISSPPQAEATSYSTSSKIIEIPNEKVVLGKRGETIRHVQLQSGAKIQVNVELIGTADQISKPDQMIHDHLSEGPMSFEETSEILHDRIGKYEIYDWQYESGDYVLFYQHDFNVYVGGLSYDIDSEKLGKLFQAAGTVEVAKVIRNIKTHDRTGLSLGVGQVKFTLAKDADQALNMFNEYDWEGRSIRVFKDAPNIIFVGNLSSNVDDDCLKKFFSANWDVLNARVMYNKETGKSLGYGFVVMAPGISQMNAAIIELDGQILNGRAAIVNFSRESPRWRHFSYEEKELETDKALQKMYSRWQRHCNIKRSEEDGQKRFNIFKEKAHWVSITNKSGEHTVELDKYGDLEANEPYAHCGQDYQDLMNELVDEGWSPMKKMSEFWTKKASMGEEKENTPMIWEPSGWMLDDHRGFG